MCVCVTKLFQGERSVLLSRVVLDRVRWLPLVVSCVCDASRTVLAGCLDRVFHRLLGLLCGRPGWRGKGKGVALGIGDRLVGVLGRGSLSIRGGCPVGGYCPSCVPCCGLSCTTAHTICTLLARH